AHHMFLTGMGAYISSFFQTTTMIISIPSVVILTVLFVSLWGGSIRFTTPMLFALAFLPMFGLGGLTGLPLGLATADLHLHDTYYVIGHFHYIVAPGTIFALFAGIYYWFPKITGRKLNDVLGRVHFVGSFIFINGIFFPMFIQGLAGVSRRLYDGGTQYAHAKAVAERTNPFMSISAWCLLAAQLPFIVNFVWNVVAAARHHKNVGDNHWDATTLEWAATTSPPLAHGNFAVMPVVQRGPYEYSSPECTDTDFLPQNANVPFLPPSGGGLMPARVVANSES
ncbi:MAG: cbb3-type cytochrome c oxidase subunit I, partial [Thermoanaerobaculia bacterium]